jgi:hypothetical protein
VLFDQAAPERAIFLEQACDVHSGYPLRLPCVYDTVSRLTSLCWRCLRRWSSGRQPLAGSTTPETYVYSRRSRSKSFVVNPVKKSASCLNFPVLDNFLACIPKLMQGEEKANMKFVDLHKPDLPFLSSLRRPEPDRLPTGLGEIDSLVGGLPRGGMTELIGPESSGRTSVMLSILAESTARNEMCALVDAQDTFDPSSAEAAGVRLKQLLWVRCKGLQQALTAIDWMAHAAGFGVLVLDLGQIPAESLRRVPLSAWYRFRRAIEHTPSVLLCLEQESSTCASLVLRFETPEIAWSRRERPSFACLLRNSCVRMTMHQARFFRAGVFEKSVQVQFNTGWVACSS